MPDCTEAQRLLALAPGLDLEQTTGVLVLDLERRVVDAEASAQQLAQLAATVTRATRAASDGSSRELAG